MKYCVDCRRYTANKINLLVAKNHRNKQKCKNFVDGILSYTHNCQNRISNLPFDLLSRDSKYSYTVTVAYLYMHIK